jgi:hypothetical protein
MLWFGARLIFRILFEGYSFVVLGIILLNQADLCFLVVFFQRFFVQILLFFSIIFDLNVESFRFN